MNKKIFVRFLIYVPLTLFCLFILFFVSENKGWTKIGLHFKKKKAEEVIAKIEEYKVKNNHYPQKLSDTGLPEPDLSGPFFYDYKDSTASYRVCFGWGLGESVTYDSRTKKWDW